MPPTSTPIRRYLKTYLVVKMVVKIIAAHQATILRETHKILIEADIVVAEVAASITAIL